MALMVSATQAAMGIATFAEAEILPALEGWRLVAGGAALVLFSRRAEAIITEAANSKMAKSLGVASADGKIDVDTAAAALKEAIRKHGKLELDIPLLGMEIKFSESNIDTLLEHIAKAG